MDLRDYSRILRKHWRFIVFCTLLTLGAAIGLTAAATPQYQTNVKFFVSTPGSVETTGLSAADRNVAASIVSYADVLAGPFTAEAVAQQVPGLDAESVEGRITATPVAGTVLLAATVTDTSPERALTIAEALTTQFPEIVQQLEQRPDGSPPAITARVTERPELPTAPVSPQPVRNLAIGLLLGLVLGVTMAVLRETLDNTVKDPEEIRELTGASILGAIAYDSGASKRPLIVQDKPRAPRAEAFRQLRTNLQFVSVDRPLKSFVITSSLPKEGKSTTACNLALTLAQAGVRVVLIEGDLRRPRVADYLGLEGAVGLTTVLIGQVPLEDAVQPWGEGFLHVLASGPIPPNPSELLSSVGMQGVLTQLENDYDVVIIDAPPLLPVTDGAILSRMTDGAVLSVRTGTTRKDELRRATDALRSVDARILGVVLNMVPKGGPDGGYGYGYGYGYGSYETDSKKPQMSAEDALQALRTSVGPTAQQPTAVEPTSPLRPEGSVGASAFTPGQPPADRPL